jgi:hypothetical protein
MDCSQTVTYSEHQISCCQVYVAGQRTVEVTRPVTHPRRWMMSAFSAGTDTADRLVSNHPVLAYNETWTQSVASASLPHSTLER